ncbi:MAG: hypothetical protein IPJ65_09360 [Archangiaceae bacterium]|nr:hypothetical protein [Archangiaceae bacterium]
MTRKRPGSGRKLMLGALFVAGCPGEQPCMTPAVNDAGMRCGCLDMYDGTKFSKQPYCDSDIGNPCALGCFNPREADGGRSYDGPDPVCFC